jgi:hypothetical protein
LDGVSPRYFWASGWRTIISAGLLHPDFRTPATVVAFECRKDGLHLDKVPAMESEGTNRIL